MSTSYHARPCAADVGGAGWLLCQPSPKLSAATHQLLRESSRVSNRREPHMCVAEFTSHVACNPTVVRRNTPHSTQFQPPSASSRNPSAVSGTQWYLLIHTWKASRPRSGAYFAVIVVSLCIASPNRIQPMWAQNPPCCGVCGSCSVSEC